MDCLLTRRRLLQIGGAGYLGLSLPQFLYAESQNVRGALQRSADACILVFLNGGPSHLDMWDMKPDAPVEIRGEFTPISTTLPGVQLCEYLPRLAKLVHHTTIIRSARHSVNNSHAAAVYAALTGHDRGEQGGGAKPTDNPAIGSVVGRLHPPDGSALPYVAMPHVTKEGAGGPPQPGFFGGWMGRQHDPFWVLGNPNDPAFRVENISPLKDVAIERLTGRRDLLREISAARARQTDQALASMDALQQKAFDLITGPASQQAFRLDQEKPQIRDAYGRNIYGQSLLLARRLIEAGTRVACLSWAPDANATWDTHGNNFTKLKNELLPQLDLAVSALLTDLIDRRMLERTLVVVMGEFGRTPRINKNGGGRDHWNNCYGLMLAGGGVKPGYVHGASDRIGAEPARDAVSPADIVATIYHCLGIPNRYELQDFSGRPFTVVPTSRVIHQVLARESRAE